MVEKSSLPIEGWNATDTAVDFQHSLSFQPSASEAGFRSFRLLFPRFRSVVGLSFTSCFFSWSDGIRSSDMGGIVVVPVYAVKSDLHDVMWWVAGIRKPRFRCDSSDSPIVEVNGDIAFGGRGVYIIDSSTAQNRRIVFLAPCLNFIILVPWWRRCAGRCVR